MTQLGVTMALLGAGSFLLNMAGREFILLMWIDFWGPAVGLLIRVGLIVGGIGLAIAGMMTKTPSSEE